MVSLLTFCLYFDSTLGDTAPSIESSLQSLVNQILRSLNSIAEQFSVYSPCCNRMLTQSRIEGEGACWARALLAAFKFIVSSPSNDATTLPLGHLETFAIEL